MPDAPAPAVPSHAEREQMLLGIDRMLVGLVRGSDLPRGEHEDAAQDLRLELWAYTLKFDPTRGAKWSTYAGVIARRSLAKMASVHRAKRGAEVHPELWDRIIDPQSVADQEGGDVTADQLFAAVQRSLTAGLLDALAAETVKGGKVPTLPVRAIVEGVAFGGLTTAQLAEQTGQQPKAVKANAKNAIRKLQRLGLTQHVAPDAKVEAILAPDPTKKHANSRKRAAPSAALPPPPVVPSEPQERSCPTNPAAEVPTCPA